MSVLSSFVYILVADVWSSKCSIKLGGMNSKFKDELCVTRFERIVFNLIVFYAQRQRPSTQ